MKTYLKILLSIALFTLITTVSYGQVGIGTITPDPSAQLDVTHSSKGILIPRVSVDGRSSIASPAEGLLVYQTEAPAGFYYYTNSQWVRLINSAESASAAPALKSAYGVNTGGTVAVILGGTSVPFSGTRLLTDGITANGDGTVFTLGEAGRYEISYGINLSAALLTASRLVMNGTTIPGSTVSAPISLSRYAATVIVDVTAGSTISAQFFGLLGVATLSGDSYISIKKLQ